MKDPYAGFQPGLESPATRLVAVEPDDSADLVWTTRALGVAQAGMVRVTTQNGDTGEIFIAAGVPFPIRVRRVWATGTTATGIVALC